MSDDFLTQHFRKVIRRDGPVSLGQFMGQANHEYYNRSDPLGAPREDGGDFVTAPEISQMFGELIGLWLADLWDRAGRPPDVTYAELGAGRGTLALDARRAMAAAGFTPAFHFVDSSVTLRRAQAKAFPDAGMSRDPKYLPESGPLLVVANEYLDALPIRQYIRTEAGWRERMVGLEGDDFVFVTDPFACEPVAAPTLPDLPVGTILEHNPLAEWNVELLCDKLLAQGGCALFIDYGSLEPRDGSTFQAVRRHRKVDALTAPGSCDLTAHVDFAVLGKIAGRLGLRVQTATQGEWLTRLGIDARAEALARKSPSQSGAVEAARARLVHPDAMGELFKVFALTAPGWPAGAGFEGDLK